MPIHLDWDTTLPNVIYYTFEGRWTWTEFLTTFEKELQIVKARDMARYDVITDFLQSAVLPKGPGIAHVYSVFRRYPPNWGITVIVNRSMLIRAMVDIGSKLHPDTRGHYYTTDTVEAARRLIQENRSD